jgi:hypothetical protein
VEEAKGLVKRVAIGPKRFSVNLKVITILLSFQGQANLFKNEQKRF